MSYSVDLDVRITDSCLRDGSHAVRHRLSVDDVRTVVTALDSAGVPVIEVAHGDGLGGSSLTYGFSTTPERELITTAVEACTKARIATMLLPGIGTAEDLKALADLGVQIARIATRCTEADIAYQHFSVARSLGLETVGFLMMAHSQPPDELAVQAGIMVDAGAQCVYVVDSSGALVPDQAADRVAALVAAIGSEAQVGFHAHENLACGVANALVAVRAGAVQIDGSTRRMAAGAGNAPTEALAAVFEKLGIRTGIDVLALIEAAEKAVRPIMDGECVLDQMSILLGYGGVYSSFLKHAARAAEQYDISGAEILIACGERRLVGGQEDLIPEIAAGLAGASRA